MRVNVYVPAKAHNDLKSMQRIMKDVLGRLGCDGCHSGYDIRFKHAIAYHVQPDMKVQELSLNLEQLG